uniref:Uncharacterized protein n=1 Tax=Oryza brachyantha TaxID=4533 RepID=J3LCS8_ORYBR
MVVFMLLLEVKARGRANNPTAGDETNPADECPCCHADMQKDDARKKGRSLLHLQLPFNVQMLI